MALIRSASLTGFRDLCAGLKVDPSRLAAAAGVPAGALTDADLKVDSGRVGKLLDLAALKSGSEDFGLRLAETRRLSNLGPVGLIAREQPSLRKALAVMSQYLWLHNEAMSFALQEHDTLVVARIDFPAGRSGGASRQAVELAIGVLCGAMRALLGPRWRPEAVHFRHAAPSRATSHRRVLGVTPRFLQDIDGILFLRKALDTAHAGADPAMAQQVERLFGTLEGSRSATARQRASDLIALLLPTGGCSADRVAAHLGMDRRTLHRRLAADGVSFRTLLDDQRASLAGSLLRGGRSCTAVAELTGFASPSAFSHWFRRRFGDTPQSHRKIQLDP